jgi:cyanophycinase
MTQIELGPLVLAGSGEYTPAMDIVDRYLLERSGDRPVLLIATSCAQEGEDVMTKWEQMGVEHFRRLGAEATPLRICDQPDADLPEYAERIAEAGLIWFSGGSSIYLAQSFAGSLSWQALESANRRGAAVAGASGGLGVLNPHVASTAPDAPPGPTGLGLAAPVRAMAHFDRMEARRPEFIERILSSLVPGQMAVGVDEDTTIVWTEGAWRAMGHKRVVVYHEGERSVFHNGESVPLLPAPLRATVPAS